MNKKLSTIAVVFSMAIQGMPMGLAAENTVTNRQEVVDVYVNTFEEKQTIKGVGGAITWYNNWLSNAENKEEIYNILFKEAGLDVIRLKNFYNYKDINFEEMAEADKENIESAQRVAGKEIPVLMSSWSPSAALKSNGIEAGGGTIKKNTDGSYMYKEVGEYYAEAVQAYRDAGVKIDYFSIQNEPDFKADYDGCELSSTESEEYAQYSKAFDATYEAFQKMENPPLMLGPDSMTASYTYINSMLSPSIEHGDGRVAAIGHHLYAGGSESNPDQFIKSMNNLRDNFPDIPKWQTEFYRGNFVQTAWLISNTFVEEDAEAYIYWDTIWAADGGVVGIEDPWHKENWKTEKGYMISDKLYGLAHFAKFTDGGYIRVDSSVDYPNNDIKIAAFNSPDKSKLALILTNTQYKNSKVKLNLNGYEIKDSDVYLSNGQDGETDRMAEKGSVDKDMIVELPAQSVMTIDITGAQGIKPDNILVGEKITEEVSIKVNAQYGTPVIDGEEEELWKKTVSEEIKTPAHGDHGATGEFKTMWDENYLYLLVKVTDKTLDDSSQVEYEQDSVEIFINESHSKADGYGEGDAQYRINYKNKQSFGNGNPDRENFETEVKQTENGYMVEAAIPLKLVAGEQGTVIGFDVQINDSHGSGTRDYILKWSDPSDNTWSSLGDIGDVRFVNMDDITREKITVEVNGEIVKFPDQEPIIINNYAMIPVRAVAEMLGMNVEWDNNTRMVIIGEGLVGDFEKLKANADEITIIVNGQKVEFQNEKPVIVNGRTMIPIYAVTQTLGLNVEWNENTYEVIITK